MAKTIEKKKETVAISPAFLTVALGKFMELTWRNMTPELPHELQDPDTGVMWSGHVDGQRRLVVMSGRYEPFSTPPGRGVRVELPIQWFESLSEVEVEIV